MSALPRPATLLHVIADDVRYGAPLEQLRLESPEVPIWVAQYSDEDLTDLLSRALAEIEPKDHGKPNKLLSALLKRGEDIPQSQAVELLHVFRVAMTDLASLHMRRKVKAEHERRHAAEVLG